MSDPKKKEFLGVHQDALPTDLFQELNDLLCIAHLEQLFLDGKDFYKETFWLSFADDARGRLEKILSGLFSYVDCEGCAGVEWWLSIQDANRTPYWLLKPHFDRSDITIESLSSMEHPTLSSVLFLRSLPYGELVITDQRFQNGEVTPNSPSQMDFILPLANSYCVFEGDLYHGVIGRMWRSRQDCDIRIALAINYWKSAPTAAYVSPTAEYKEIMGIS